MNMFSLRIRGMSLLILRLSMLYLFWVVSPWPAAADSPRWTRVLSGEPIGAPVTLGNRSVTVTDDRSVTCLDRDGSFLWSRQLQGRATPYVSAIGDDFVCSVSLPGRVSLFSADGNALWQTKGSTDPVAAPIAGRDGRIFVVYRDAVRCFAVNGLQLWRVGIPTSFTGLAAETGDGDLILGLEGSNLAIISPFGEYRETAALTAPASDLAPIPSGFAVSHADGRIQAWDVRPGRASTPVWTLADSSSPAALAVSPGTLFSVRRDGTVYAVNPTDGALLWSGSTGLRFPEGFRALRDYGQYYVVSTGLVCAVSDGGTLLWSLKLPENTAMPAIASDGTVYAPSSGWQLNAWTGERRIGGGTESGARASYGVLTGAGKLPGWFAHPDTEEISSFFTLVADSIAYGAGRGSASGDFVGVDEPLWARRLAAIVKGTTFGAALPPGVREGFFETEQARAASLLGQLGSAEYRDFLVEQSKIAHGETLSLGILYGLAAAGGGSGEVGDAVRGIIRSAGSANDAVNRAACDTLYALVKYGNDRDAREYAALLVAFTKAPYGPSTQEYARQVIGNIVQ